MALKDIMKVKGKRIIGIDASTNSLAFAIFEDDKPVQCGEVTFNGSTVFERLKDAKRKFPNISPPLLRDLQRGDCNSSWVRVCAINAPACPAFPAGIPYRATLALHRGLGKWPGR
jgi:hypothetical protein